jgi:hypothetical protein
MLRQSMAKMSFSIRNDREAKLWGFFVSFLKRKQIRDEYQNSLKETKKLKPTGMAVPLGPKKKVFYAKT